uniref:Late embryogenesis abundant protein LEA-2 subgroup domain-containing protein n=1 Tax=Ananas comosus var. bracteatus TaxID=296719 RepID=A0A6V7QJK6_ANACO|nr:unnamed protein product [Ananas comosus var. bracteatus]
MSKERDEICCILKFGIFVVGIILTLVLLLGAFHTFRVSIEDAALSRFSVTSSPISISYNFTVAVEIRNPNLNIGIYYDSLEASYLFDGQVFATTTFPSFYQRPRGATVLHPVIEGSSIVPHLAGDAAAVVVDVADGGLLGGNETSVFGLEVQISAVVRYQRHREHCRFEVKCPMSALAVTQSSTDNTFKRVKCDVKRKPGFFC